MRNQTTSAGPVVLRAVLGGYASTQLFLAAPGVVCAPYTVVPLVAGEGGMSTDTAAQRLVIPGFLPPDIANASRQRHWTAIRKSAKATQTMVWASAKHAGWCYIGDDAPKMRLTVVLVFGVHRRRDQDNLVARCKHLIDGLKPFLIDDDIDHLELVVRAEVRKGIKQTELLLEPAGSAQEGG